jgi:hypothetical protein
VLSLLVLYPILAVPVIADDFANPFIQANDGGSSLLDGVEYGWGGSVHGASFRLIGTTAGGIQNWAILWLSAKFDIDIAILFAILKFAVLVTCAASMWYCWRQWDQFRGRPRPGASTFFVCSAALFLTLQIHALWSNDPVTSYPVAGFGATAAGLFFLGAALRFLTTMSLGSASIAAVVGVVAVGIYELNLGAVLAAALMLCLVITRRWRAPAARLRLLVGGGLALGTPTTFLFVGRALSATKSETYTGTTLRLGSKAISTFGLGLVGTLPGASWRLSIRSLGGTLGVVPMAIGVTILLLWVAAAWRLWPRQQTELDPPGRDPIRDIVGLTAALLYWLFAIAVQAATVKVQDETSGVGYTYTAYAVGASIVGLFIAMAASSVARRRLSSAYVLMIATVAVVFVGIQLTINWRLSEQLQIVYERNTRLLAAFDADTSPDARCAAIGEWTVLEWPEYYEAGVVQGIDQMYEHYFGERFCPD